MHGIRRQDPQQIDSEDGAGLSEQGELSKLPADDEEHGGAGHGHHVPPVWSRVPAGDAH